MTITSSAMINIGCHISFMWATKFGCTCRNNALQKPIGRLSHSVMGRTPSTRMWVTIILSSTFPFPWPTPSLQRGSHSTIFPTIIRHLRDSREIDTNIAQP